jgi:hypothetical protein
MQDATPPSDHFAEPMPEHAGSTNRCAGAPRQRLDARRERTLAVSR